MLLAARRSSCLGAARRLPASAARAPPASAFRRLSPSAPTSTAHPTSALQRRPFLQALLGRKSTTPDPEEYTPSPPPPPSPDAPQPRELLAQNDLFHPLSSSPFEDLRLRAERIKLMAPCPVCLEHFGERNLVAFDSPDAGWPTHCSEEHWKADDDHHKYVGRLREANEDEHDLRSGRPLVEFENLPGFQPYDSIVNFTNWDTYFYTRNFPSLDNLRVFRHMTKVLTFPVTIASVFTHFSPYTRGSGRLTLEGKRSLDAIRSTLNPERTPKPVPGLNSVVRVFILGARAESSLPPTNWEQLSRMFPKAQLKVFFVGPQAALPRNWTPREVFDSADDDGRVGEMRAKGGPEEQQQQQTTTAPATELPAASPATASSSSTAAPSAPAAGPSSPSPSSSAVASASSTVPAQAARKSLDHLPDNSADRQRYPYTAFDGPTSVAPLPPSVDRSSLSSVEGAYGPTFYVPPTPTLTVTRASELSPAGRDESDLFGAPAFAIPVSPGITLTSVQAPYEAIHDQFGPFDPYSDAFFAFSPGFGFPSSIAPGKLQVEAEAEWGETLPLVLETKCPLFITGFSPKDVERDVQSLVGLDGVDGKFDWLINPGENFFASEKWEVADFDPRVLVKTNWGLWAIRGRMNDIAVVDGDADAHAVVSSHNDVGEGEKPAAAAGSGGPGARA